MYWAIIWDIIWSIYEWDNIKTKKFPLFPNGVFFTDDTVLTVATTYAILNRLDFWESYKKFYKEYPWKWYWWKFIEWCENDTKLFGIFARKQNSFWNWSAMRISPIWYFSNNLEEVLKISKISAKCTHWHKEWIKWAQSVASAIFLARQWKNKNEIKKFIEEKFWYDLNRKIDDIRLIYDFDVTCQWSVPESIIAFLESNDFEDAIRNAISIWWDSDTIACITWSIAEAYYWIPKWILELSKTYLDDDMIILLDEFYEKYK